MTANDRNINVVLVVLVWMMVVVVVLQSKRLTNTMVAKNAAFKEIVPPLKVDDILVALCVEMLGAGVWPLKFVVCCCCCGGGGCCNLRRRRRQAVVVFSLYPLA